MSMNRKFMCFAARFGFFCGYLAREIDMNNNSSDTPCESGSRSY